MPRHGHGLLDRNYLFHRFTLIVSTTLLTMRVKQIDIVDVQAYLNGSMEPPESTGSDENEPYRLEMTAVC